MFSTYYPLCFPEYAHFMEQKWNINNGKIMDLKNGKKMEKKPGFFFIGLSAKFWTAQKHFLAEVREQPGHYDTT